MPWLPAFPPPLLLMSHDSDDTHPASEFEERSFRRKSILWRYILPWKHRKLFAENDLALLGEAADSSQLPFLKVAAGAALQIERQKPSGEAAVVAAEAVETVVILWKSYQQAPDRDIWKQATAKLVEGLAVMLDEIRGRMTYEAERGLLYSVLHGNICRAKMEAYRAELQSILVKIASCHLDLQEISSSPSDSDISHSNDQIKSFDGNVMPDQEDCIVFCEDESNPNIKGVEAEDATVSQSVRQARKRRGKARQTCDIPEAVMSCPGISGAGAPSSSAATYPPYPGPDLPFSPSTSYIPGNFSPYGGYFQSSGMPTPSTSSLNGIYALPLSPPAPTENQNMGTLPRWTTSQEDH
ncbi:hypothetical protein NLJ89_g9290 [Agrocybe chaxingu]|uniref:Uncharacterized protein n=1 Tax=Agrocybe chaxingu TaxID=84603 RepID=A0A9W8JTM0_9AGAR|nr:hypothetical protein NLJ89_g9290 [Agrocybe chaxingu]